MLKPTATLATAAFALLCPALALPASAHASPAAAAAKRPAGFALRARVAVDDREQDGLVGPVRRVRTETAKLTLKEGRVVEGQRKVLETATYDIKGAKIDNQYFLSAGGSLTGKEVYKYDDKGNITEMALYNGDGSLLSKEVYQYEFDALGNWTKMTTSVAVLEGGRVTYEPSEVTYRMIAYYLDESTVAKLTQPATPAAASASVPTTNAPAQPNSAASSVPAPQSNQSAQANGAAQVKTSAPAQNTPAPAKAAVVPASMSNAPRHAPSATQPEVATLDRAKTTAAAANTSAAAPVVRDAGEAPPSPQPAMRAPVKPISGGVLNGQALKLPPPQYPLHAKSARVTGTVVVEVVIDVTGKVISAKAVSGPEMLHQAAEAAAKQARFSPTTLSGQPVKVSGVINYSFAFAQ